MGRTGRIGNKSQYSVVLHDPDAKNEDGRSYLEKKLEILQNIDLQRLSSKLYQPQHGNTPSPLGHIEEEKTEKNLNAIEGIGAQKVLNESQILNSDIPDFTLSSSISIGPENKIILSALNESRERDSSEGDEPPMLGTRKREAKKLRKIEESPGPGGRSAKKRKELRD
jgi:hypothetical protein